MPAESAPRAGGEADERLAAEDGRIKDKRVGSIRGGKAEFARDEEAQTIKQRRPGDERHRGGDKEHVGGRRRRAGERGRKHSARRGRGAARAADDWGRESGV